MPDVVTLPDYFKQQGYHTQAFGKIYHAGLDDPQSWSGGAAPAARIVAAAPTNFPQPPPRRKPKTKSSVAPRGASSPLPKNPAHRKNSSSTAPSAPCAVSAPLLPKKPSFSP